MSPATVLYIVHDFPPLGGGGVMRSVKFAKYLPEFGWRPVFLTLSEEYYLPHLLDRSLFDSLPAGLEIHRTPSLKPRGATRTAVVQTSLGPASGPKARMVRALRNAKRALEHRFMVAQDEGYLWLPHARREIDAILAAQQVDAVITTSPPHAVHWLGYYTREVTGIPWLADFRDGWTGDKLFQSRSELRNAFDRWQERQIIGRADRVTAAAEKFHEWFLEAHGAAYAAKSQVLHNGFDPADFAPLQAQNPPPPGSGAVLTLAHLGGVGSVRRPVRPLLEALRTLEACGVPAGSFRLELVGTVAGEDVEEARATPGVTVTPHLPHAEALRRMQAADVLVLIQGRMSADSHSGKLFEYVAARRPILTLTPPGQLAEFVTGERWGWVAHPEDVAAIQHELLRIYALWKEGRLPAAQPSVESQARFDRRVLAEKLASTLDAMVGGRAGSVAFTRHPAQPETVEP